MKAMLTELRRWQDEGEEIALATLVRVQGSAPRRPGARLGVTRGGRVLGSVSGGCVENEVVEAARRVLDSGRPELTSYAIGDEPGSEAGLSCGGRIDVLTERFREDESWRAVGSALEAHRPLVLCIGMAPAALRGRRLVVDGEQTAGSIDATLDAAIAARARALCGGDEARVEELPERGGGASSPTPCSRSCGSRSPEEAALAILAEMVAVLNRADARPLFAGRGPIHAS